ncbi:MAG TPA: hypothetical protein DCG53_11880 [Syntrophus sp. (in: bacteria)]|nr:hypothetical protein [Syntrophus sp. (in: bacteria)]
MKISTEDIRNDAPGPPLPYADVLEALESLARVLEAGEDPVPELKEIPAPERKLKRKKTLWII